MFRMTPTGAPRKIAPLFLPLLGLIYLFCGLGTAEAAVSFLWQANPPEEEVLGYRLYYGTSSRYVVGGYAQYIDFGSLQRCPADGHGLGCVPLGTDAVTCENLYRDSPKCTVNDLSGHLFFAMTAYNATSEGEYSAEVEYVPPGTISPKLIMTLHLVYSLLLEDF